MTDTLETYEAFSSIAVHVERGRFNAAASRGSAAPVGIEFAVGSLVVHQERPRVCGNARARLQLLDLQLISLGAGEPAPPPNIAKVAGHTVKTGHGVARKVVVLDAATGEKLGSAIAASNGSFEIEVPVTTDVVIAGMPADASEKPYVYRVTPEPL
jgi:hypothetical protein